MSHKQSHDGKVPKILKRGEKSINNNIVDLGPNQERKYSNIDEPYQKNLLQGSPDDVAKRNKSQMSMSSGVGSIHGNKQPFASNDQITDMSQSAQQLN